jgi:hypothetical protein
MIQRINQDFLDRQIIEIITPEQLEAERAAKPWRQSTTMCYLQGLPFKVPKDLRPFYSVFFTAPKPGKRLDRGVLALGSKKLKNSGRFLNDYAIQQKFRMDGLVQLCMMLLASDWIMTADLTEAYMTIHQNPRYNMLTRYQCYNREGVLITYQMKVLCYGHGQAPCAFTKFWAPILDYARAVVGIRALILLDDIIALNQCKQTLVKQFQFLVDLAIYLGFIIKNPKCRLSPSQQRVWSGALIDSTTMALYLPRKKRRGVSQSARRLIKWAKQNRNITMRQYASVVGLLRSCLLMVLLTRLRTQFLVRKSSHLLHGRKWTEVNWDGVIPPLIPEEINELEWWATQLEKHNGRPVKLPQPDLITASDASGLGAGLIVTEDSPLHVDLPFDSRWHFTPRERLWHITRKELAAPLPGIIALDKTARTHGAPAIKNLVWLNKTDNQVGNIYINKQGGKKLELMLTAKAQWEWCLKRAILPISEYMTGDEMIVSGADLQSREIYSQMEWKMKEHWFQKLDQLWGPHTIDAFASGLNHQLPRFYSRWNEKNSEARDALKQNPTDENWFCNPPHVLIPYLLDMMRRISDNNKSKTIELTLITRAPLAWFTPVLRAMSIQPPILIEDHQLMQPVVHDHRAKPRPTFWNFMAWRLSTRRALKTV